jgi:GT2 family glycosyltransferase
MSYAVVIVNWNGAADTLACLDTILASHPAAHVVVVDNGSRDDSLERIDTFLSGRGLPPLRLAAARPGEVPAALDPARRTILVEARANLGFAAGSNVGLAVAAAMGLQATVFLNNDTLVEADALERIVARLLGDEGLFVCLPLLTLHGSDRIWNAGGTLYPFGLRRYHHAGARRAQVHLPPELPCSFFTGCCLAVRTAAFRARGGFSERFFFGEEDFELALWMRDHKLTGVCLTDAVVQHKVSASFTAAAGPRQEAKVFIYYLNRFIHMRLRFGPWRWWLWVGLVLPYAAGLLWLRQGWSGHAVLGFVRRLLRLSRRMQGVSRADFEAVMAGSL